MSKYDWSKAPDWATAAATDEDGEKFWYENVPLYNADGVWRRNGGRVKRIDDSAASESLESRPTHSEPEWLSEQRVNMGAKP